MLQLFTTAAEKYWKAVEGTELIKSEVIKVKSDTVAPPFEINKEFQIRVMVRVFFEKRNKTKFLPTKLPMSIKEAAAQGEE